jgi:hypothetical protein
VTARRDNSKAIAALERVIAQLQAVADAPKDIAPEVAAELKSIIDRNIETSRGPDGVAWQRTQDGRQPLRNAAKAVTVEAHGSRIVASVTGPEAYHHMGRTRGNIVRAILPAKRLPAPFILAIKRAIAARVAAAGEG